jgi:hypothetical protein
VPKLAKGSPSTAEPGFLAPVGSKGESVVVLKVMGQEKTESAGAPKHPAEAKDKTVEEPGLEEPPGLPKILSPLAELELPKVSKVPAITPKRRRMASVLDAILESIRAPTPASITARVEVEARPSMPVETEPVKSFEQSTRQGPSDATLILEK